MNDLGALTDKQTLEVFLNKSCIKFKTFENEENGDIRISITDTKGFGEANFEFSRRGKFKFSLFDDSGIYSDGLPESLKRNANARIRES